MLGRSWGSGETSQLPGYEQEPLGGACASEPTLRDRSRGEANLLFRAAARRRQRRGGHVVGPGAGQHAASAGSESRAIRAEPPLQDHRRGDVRHLRQVRRDPADSARQRVRHARDRVCGVRGHLRREECRRPPVRLQRLRPLPGRALLPADQDAEAARHRARAKGARRDASQAGHRHGRRGVQPRQAVAGSLFTPVCPSALSRTPHVAIAGLRCAPRHRDRDRSARMLAAIFFHIYVSHAAEDRSDDDAHTTSSSPLCPPAPSASPLWALSSLDVEMLEACGNG